MGINFEMWAVNVYFLIGLLIALTILFIVGILLYAYIRSCLWRAAVKRAERLDYQQKHRPDGSTLPPVARGICDSCATNSEKVYFLASGTRLCENCFQQFEQTPSTNPRGNNSK